MYIYIWKYLNKLLFVVGTCAGNVTASYRFCCSYQHITFTMTRAITLSKYRSSRVILISVYAALFQKSHGDHESELIYY